MSARVIDFPANDPASAVEFRQFICRACGLVYDERDGDPDSGLAAGTRFEDIPDDWSCPLCGVTKSDFEPHVAEARAERQGAAEAAPAARGGDPGVVIIGAGMAGWQMARALRERDADVPITLVTGCSGDVYDKPMLSIALARGIGTASLVKETGHQAALRLGLRLLADTVAVNVCPEVNTVRSTRGAIRYRHLVLAHGASPRMDAALPPELCWAINDLRCYARFRAAVDATGHPQRIAIVGAGLVGCELANDLALAGHPIMLLDVADRPLAALLPESSSNDLLNAWEPLPIEFMGRTRVKSVSKSMQAIRVETSGGVVFDVDQVISATGLQTPSRLARSAGLTWNNGISVRASDLRTNVDNIHALGDCISIEGQPLRFIEPIGRQAKVLAARMTGTEPLAYAHRRPVVRVKTSSHGFTV